MAQVINTNVAALFAGAALNKSAIALQTAQQRLSSGLRINSARDDASGLLIATGYDSTVRGANAAVRLANDGISKAQISDGYLGQVTENLQRLYELAVQGGGTASGTEAASLITENIRIAALAVGIGSVVNKSDGTTTYTGQGSAPTLTSGSSLTIAQINTDLGTVNTSRAAFGADMSVLQATVATLQIQSVNTSAAYSRIMDTDYAAETTAMTRNNILQQAGTAVLAQANQVPNTVLTLLR
jgi:flagellin